MTQAFLQSLHFEVISGNLKLPRLQEGCHSMKPGLTTTTNVILLKCIPA